MTKNKLAKQEEILTDDFAGFESSYAEGEMTDAMDLLVKASNHQMKMAIELTRLIIENNAAQSKAEDGVFSIFKKACKVVSENYALKTILKELDMN